MTTATSSVVDVPRTDNAIRGHNSGQCSPMPLPALGTQRIVQGNGTSVGTVISLLCPDRHRLVGQVECVWDSNSTQWSGDTPLCEPLPQLEDFGFRVAVVASIVSSAIILFMSMSFITCCLVDWTKKTERKKQQREARLAQGQDRSSLYQHKGRNNNNNNNNTTTQEERLALWDDPAPGRCHQHRCAPTGPPSGATLPSAPPPCRGYDRPHIPAPPRYPGPPSTIGLLQGSALSSSGSGPARQHGGGRQESGVSAASRPFLDDARGMSRRPLGAQECSVCVISV